MKRRRLLAGRSLVVIETDCRDVAQKVDGQQATYLGRFHLKDFPVPRSRCRKSRVPLSANPVFELADGTRLWGIQCWWYRAPATQRRSVGDNGGSL